MVRKPADWEVDPAWPAVPPEPDIDLPRELDTRAPMKRRVDELAGEARRLSLELHRRQRTESARQAPARRPGNPGNPARNDRLLALYDALPPRLSKLRRCSIAAEHYAAELGSAAVLPATTARDAIDEARRRRLARK